MAQSVHCAGTPLTGQGLDTAGTFSSAALMFLLIITEKLKNFLKIYRNTKKNLAQHEVSTQHMAALLTNKAKEERHPQSAQGPTDVKHSGCCPGAAWSLLVLPRRPGHETPLSCHSNPQVTGILLAPGAAQPPEEPTGPVHEAQAMDSQAAAASG